MVGKNLAKELSKSHNVTTISTDGVNNIYTDNLEHLIRPMRQSYDMQISYTAMHNFKKYLANGSKNRFGIYNYEFTVLPKGYSKFHLDCDLLLPSSQFSFDIFAQNKIPKEKMRVISHGVDFDRFKNAKQYPLVTRKSVKFFANIAQPHIRKNIIGMLEAWGKAFDKTSDTCLVLKVVDKIPEMAFEQNFTKLFNEFKLKYKNHAEIEVIKNYVPNIEDLYYSTDALFMIPNAECFHFPSLEMLSLSKPVISSNYGGQLDFLNKENSILIDGKMIRAPKNAHYYESSVYSEMFEPNIDCAVAALRNVAANYAQVKSNLKININELTERFSWESVANQMTALCRETA